jgi:cytidine deaminase
MSFNNRAAIEISPSQAEALLVAAQEASQYAYAPYSDFPVGAALLLEDGSIVMGANIENASFGLTLCAERCAITKAVSSGNRHFIALAVWAAKRPNGAITPCGACRQVLAEFLNPNACIIMSDAQSATPRTVTIATLLPDSFTFQGE